MEIPGDSGVRWYFHDTSRVTRAELESQDMILGQFLIKSEADVTSSVTEPDHPAQLQLGRQCFCCGALAALRKTFFSGCHTRNVSNDATGRPETRFPPTDHPIADDIPAKAFRASSG
jgi:hypothetical protein